MRTHLNLGMAFRDSLGSLIVCLQLMETGKRAAIGIADFRDGINTRFLFSEKSAAHSHPKQRKAQFRIDSAECADPRTIKSLEWAYPSSQSAADFGFEKSGCWVIKLGKPSQPSHAVRAFAEKEFDYALRVTRGLPFEWCRFCLHVNPQYAASNPLLSQANWRSEER